MFPREDSKRRCSGGCVSRRRAHQSRIVGLRSPSHLDPAGVSCRAVASRLAVGLRKGWLCEDEATINSHQSTLNSVRAGFTLLELLIVIGIIALLLVLIAPAFTNLKSAGDVTSAVYGIQGLLENARTYAKANHTYVFVGFAEVDASVSASASPQVPGNGRVAIGVVASKDGTRQFNYATSNQGSDWTANYSNGANLIAVGKLQRYENLHFLNVNFPSWLPSQHSNSNMARYQPASNTYNLGTSSSVTPFSWPLGSSLGNGQYNFTIVVNFDPTGIARVATSTNADEIASIMELDLLTTHGTAPSPTPTPFNQDIGNHAAIQIAPMSGEVRVYRP
jgi:prepilin-type N-terminal cleavage/methylation domain-containing protein